VVLKYLFCYNKKTILREKECTYPNEERSKPALAKAGKQSLILDNILKIIFLEKGIGDGSIFHFI